ncbi:hypothetical protein GNI_110260 [Gregarina niphandrodes]|uniref:Uncharacterized protein n=1 Tax=Gregarina niphandrodes TaxID=110365 RepID=A0A023B3L9_GRENI|nr:hypothetical protein GNI_110260 [Gregarina niphandrodes]EZG55655.1 hypothetical protein GNI_110260 [Gregarina niphandrodes]|eukprot:XP_011131474.1 hypothetical protein GNI_110260 [Gregarina niphandrodes]
MNTIWEDAKLSFHLIKLSVSCWGRKPHVGMQALLRLDVETFRSAFSVGECADSMSELWHEHACQALPGAVATLTKNACKGSFRSLEGFHRTVLLPAFAACFWRRRPATPTRLDGRVDHAGWSAWLSNIAQTVAHAINHEGDDAIHDLLNFDAPQCLTQVRGVRLLCKVYVFGPPLCVVFHAQDALRAEGWATVGDALDGALGSLRTGTATRRLVADPYTEPRLAFCCLVAGVPAPRHSPLLFWFSRYVAWNGCLELAVRLPPVGIGAGDIPAKSLPSGVRG